MPLKNIDSYNTPKDFFIYLLSIITLYIFFTSFIALLFKFVNIYFPDNLDISRLYNIESIRWYVAIIIITFPVYIYTLISIRKDYLRYPEKRNLKVRKWLLYFTLFLASVIIMCDLGTLLYYFLGGDITVRFLLKTLIIFLLVTTLFIFYLRELHRGWPSFQAMIWLWLTLILVLMSLVYGFYLIGTPEQARQELIDEKRVNDLTSIQSELLQYWRQKKQLPNNLDELTNPISGYKAPDDPVTKNPYRYKVLSAYTFQLCSVFSTPSETKTFYKINTDSDLNWNWAHPAGYYCFQRTIDPELYKNK